eukprot:7836592-Pyramimonas_sp.AAC.1
MSGCSGEPLQLDLAQFLPVVMSHHYSCWIKSRSGLFNVVISDRGGTSLSLLCVLAGSPSPSPTCLNM